SIIGGTADNEDTGVVALVGTTTAMKSELCSGSLVSPHVIVTAAHCLPDGISVKVYGGANLLVAGVGDFRPTQAVYTQPSFDENNPQNGFDIGAVVLTNAIRDVAPLPMNRAPLTGDALGKTVQVIRHCL